MKDLNQVIRHLPSELFSSSNWITILQDEIRKCPDLLEFVDNKRLRYVLKAYCVEGRTFAEIAEIIGVSRSYTSTLHKQALSNLYRLLCIGYENCQNSIYGDFCDYEKWDFIKSLFSTRVGHILLKNQIYYPWQLAQLTPSSLEEMQQMGKQGIKEVLEKTASFRANAHLVNFDPSKPFLSQEPELK